MKDRLARPPSLVVVERVLGKAADVNDSVLRADVRPSIRRGFASIIESRPHESPGKPLSRIAESPPAFRRGASGGRVWVIRRNVSFRIIGDVDSARPDGAHRLGADDRLFGILIVELLRLGILVVVTGHVAGHQPAYSNRADRRNRYGSRAVELVCERLHGGENQQSFI